MRGWWLLAAGLTACGGTVEIPGGDPSGPEPPSPAPVSECPDPAGPVGLDVGSIVDGGLCVLGREGSEGPLEELCLGDLLRCGDEGPGAIVLTAQAVWSQPSKAGTSQWVDILGAVDAKGGRVVHVLVDGPAPGVPADTDQLDSWVTAFELTVFSAVDPDYQLGSQLDPSIYPVYWLIDPDDLRVEARVSGIPPDSFWQAVDAELVED